MSSWIDQKYIGLVSTRLSNFSKKNTSYNFRCHYCGDSKKDKNKARGYLYPFKDTYRYKCQNCGLSVSLGDFLEKIDPSLYSAYRLESFENKTVITKEVVPEPKASDKNILLEYGLLPLDKIEKYDPFHIALSYVRGRKIPPGRYSDLFYCRNMKIFEQMNTDYKDRLVAEERLAIPFRNKFGEITGVACRSLGASKKRYVNVRLSNYPLVYGLDRVDFTEKVFVFEGAIDSMFIRNAVAPGGSDLKRVISMFDKNQLVFVFDNEPRNKDIIRIMSDIAKDGYAMTIWPQTWQHKDINEAVMKDIPVEHIRETIISNTHSGLSLQLAMNDWKKI